MLTSEIYSLMKLSRPDILRRQLVPCTLLIALTALIWLGWPQLNTVPPVASRLYLTLAIYLTWALKLIFIDLSPPTHSSPALSPELRKQFTVLEGRLDGVLRFLQKTPLSHRGTSSHFAALPWHLIIGPKGSGKTAFLAHSGMRFALSKKFTEEALAAIPPSTTSEWWVTRDLVLVDTPGSWSLWQAFLSLLQKKDTLTKLSGVVVTLNLPELMQQGGTSFERTLDLLRNQIKHLRATLGHHLSFYLVITKCDLLRGFSEFFRDSSREELASAWGITLPPRDNKTRLQDVVAQRFNQLIKQLNSQLVLRLHQERDIRLRPLIKDFPLEIERLRDQILQSLNLTAPDLPLRGIWLTSATQAADVSLTDREVHQTGTHLTLSAPLLWHAVPTPSKSYFIRNVIQHGLPGWSGKVLPRQKHNVSFRRSLYTLAGGLLVAAVIVLGKDFSEGVSEIQVLENSIQRYEEAVHQSVPLRPTPARTLALVTALQTEQPGLDGPLRGFHQRLISYYSARARLEASKLYIEALKTLLLPSLAQSLDAWLQNISNKTAPGQLYSILSARLMLSGDIPLDAHKLLKALTGITDLSQDQTTTARFMAQMEKIKQYAFKIPADPDRIEQARQQLTHLPVWQLGMLLLENNFIAPNSPDESQMPPLFMKRQFDRIIQQDIPETVRETLSGNLILGKKITHIDRRVTGSVMTLLSNRFLQNYAKTWVQRLHHLTLTKPADLFATDALIAGFIDGSAPEWQALQSVSDNTSFSPILQMNPALTSLNSLFAEDPRNNQSRRYQNKTALNWLHQTLQGILTAEDPREAASERIRQSVQSPDKNSFGHLREIAQENPEPLKTWLTQIADTSWRQTVVQSGMDTVSPVLLEALSQIHPSEATPVTHQKKKLITRKGIPPLVKKLMDSEAVADVKDSHREIASDEKTDVKPDSRQKSSWTLNLNLPKMDIS